MKKRLLSLLLCLSLTVGLMPASALAAEDSRGTLHAHEGCGAALAQQVESYDALKNAIEGGSGVIDLVLHSGGSWSAAAPITIGSGKTVHMTVAAGDTVTITRRSGYTGTLFNVSAGGTLILGNGKVQYTGSNLTDAAQNGNYTVETDTANGMLTIDGGAVWTNPTDWTPGATFGDNTGKRAVLYDENGSQKQYRNSGLVCSDALITSVGTVNLWDGVVLQNNVTTADAGSAIRSNSGSTLNFYGGTVTGCVVASSSGDTGRGAVFVGNFVPGNWNTKVTPTNTHFNMYGGCITRNAASGNGYQDGGGISVEQGYMDLYGGEVSYNHAGVWYDNGGSGDGGGIMVRNYTQFHMWGGSVDHNFAGGYGGGIVAWNAAVHIHGGEIRQNKAAYGGGLAIASSQNANAEISSEATMHGGLIASNEAINDTSAAALKSDAGVGGGICVGSGTRTEGSTLKLSGGEIRQNTAANGGGLGIYAGGGQSEGALKNTAVSLSGDFRLASNFADRNGNGMYIINMNRANRHYLVKMAGGACVDTNNPVYFANLCRGQVPVQVTETLTSEGTAAIFEFADSFWNGAATDYDGASADRKVIDFAAGQDVQENKIALESASWYLHKVEHSLALQELSNAPLYTIRNGTPVTVDGMAYYRIYAQLSDAFQEAASGDVLYIYYNTTVDTPAVLSAGKRVTVMAESTSSAGRDAAVSGSGPTKTCWLEHTSYGYDAMRGDFLKYVGSGGNYHVASGNAQAAANGEYRLDTGAADSYNIRNDYTITLSSRLYLGESAKGSDAQPGAVIVEAGAVLEVGQTATAGMGAGTLTFDGNLSSPKEGAMFQSGGTLRLHSGVTVKNHSNYSKAHPGAIEVLRGGSLTVEEGVTVTGNISPVAGAVYVAEGGSFEMEGGSLTDNRGAMPRYGFFTAQETRLNTYDTAYWGQAKYYSGAGAVYNRGSFTMNGGAISGNRGEYGALANLGAMTLTGGTVTENHAQRGTGSGAYSLAITGYTERANPAIPQEADYAPDAGSGGGIYQGSGTVAKIGRGVVISGNTAVNGGGAAVGSGRDMTQTVTRYVGVTGGYEKTTGKTVQARVPQYGQAPDTTPAQAGLILSAGASLTENQAEELGGGLFVTGTGNYADVEQSAVLRRNSAGRGGGIAVYEGSTVSFSNEVTENTAVSGGGVYVGGGSTVIAKGSITSNEAENGGGAYVDSTETGAAGRLLLDGALVNNNRLTGGVGGGVYSRGDLELTAESGSQPSVSYNDRIYLETGRVVTLSKSYDINQSNQSENNRLTLESQTTDNGTQLLRADSEKQALETLVSGRIIHYTHPLAQNQEDKTQLEINAVPVYYYDRFRAEGGLESHRAEVPYAQGSTVIFQNFTVGEEQGFVLASGMSFLYWVTIDKDGHYLDSDGRQVATPKEAQAYYAGNTIQSISQPIYLEAVYGSVTYTATLQVLDEAGNVVPGESIGSIALNGASYNSGTGEYSYAMGTPMTVSAAPSDGSLYGQTVLQGLKVYQEVPQQSSSEDFQFNGAWWHPVAWANMEQEVLNVPGEAPETVLSTGRITGVEAAVGTAAGLDSEGRFTYTASNARILVRAQFKPAMVRMDMAEENSPVSFTGYYDTMHEAVSAVTARVKEGHKTTRYTITLLQDNGKDENGNGVVLYYGEKGEDADKCLDNKIPDLLNENDVVHLTYDLNGHTLDYQNFGERNLKQYDMTIRNGTVIYHGNEDRTNPDKDPIPSAFRVAEGTLTLEGVTIRTTGTPNGGNNNKVYSAKVMEKGTLNVGRGCTLGDVFIYTDRDTIGTIGPDGSSEGSGHITVTDTFVEGRTELVATLCLRYWDFENQVRRVLMLDESVAAREGVAIRRMFELKDVSEPVGEGTTDNAAYWFIGTDGKLYKKAWMMIPELQAVDTSSRQEPLTRYWDYQNKNNFPEIGLAGSGWRPGDNTGTDPAWIGGIPFFYDYTSTFGFSADTSVNLTAQLVDGKGEPLEVDRGTVAFTVSRLTKSEDGTTSNRRSFSGTTGLSKNGSASLPFSSLSGLPVTDEVDMTERREAPSSSYVVSASWSGAGQYAPAYAEYWNYAQGTRDEQSGILGGTLTGALRLSIQRKELSSSDIEIASVTPYSAEYIGPAGRANGYTSAPTVGRVIDHSLNRAMIPGVDYNIYFAALTTEPERGVKDDKGKLLVCEHEGTAYYYIAGGNGGKLYYSAGGTGKMDGSAPEHALDLNGAPAGSYSVALEAETLPDSNYAIQSGWKNTLFTIYPYRSSLSIQALNHVVAAPGENKGQVITKAFEELGDGLKVTDRYGNELELKNCAFTFLPVSGKAELDSDGWPKVEGLYNIAVTVEGHGNGTMKLSGVIPRDSLDPNYAETAAGYLAMLVTDRQLQVFFVPETVNAPYTGEIYTSDMLKAMDGEDGNQYQVWRTEVDNQGRPLDEAGNVISVEEIPARGKNRERLAKTNYRLEIGSPRNTPREVGSYTMVVTDVSGAYVGIGTLHITTKSIHDITLSENGGIYTGVDHTPDVTVRDTDGHALARNRDYVVRITDGEGHEVGAPINAGTYTYTAVGINNYAGRGGLSATYTVRPKDLGNTDVAGGVRGVILDAPNYAFLTGSAVIPRYSLYYNGEALVRGDSANADYTQTITKSGQTYDVIREAGNYTFTITGKGNYTGTTSFTLAVTEAGGGKLNVTNTGQYTYGGGNFESYRWQQSAIVNLAEAGGTTQSLDAYQFDISLKRVGVSSALEEVDPSEVLDAGVYVLTLTPTAEYAARIDGLETSDTGSCVFQIERRAVTIQLAPSSKVYGQRDPDWSRMRYTTDLTGAEPDIGFFAHDAGALSGQFGRNTGEDVRNGGYRYTLGSFSAGDNYVLTVSTESVFTIEPKDITAPTLPGEADEITVEKREYMAYTGYGLDPIRSVVYHAQQKDIPMAEQANYLTAYERWIPGSTEGCTPACQVEDCGHHWESVASVPNDVAWYRATVDGDACISSPNNYVGRRSFLFEVRVQGGPLDVDVEGADTVVYKKEDFMPVVTVKREGFALSQEYYALSYSFAPTDGGTTQAAPFFSGKTPFRDAGVYTVYAAGSGNYAGSAGSATFTVLPKNIAPDDTEAGTTPVTAKVTEGQSFTYNGKAQQADVTADYEAGRLTEKDYSLSYQSHVDAGTAIVTMTGKGNYTGTRTLTYPIEKQPLIVTVGNGEKIYGSPDPNYNYTVRDTDGNQVAVRLTGAADRAEGESVGSYALGIGTLSAGNNYTLTLEAGSFLTIGKKALGDGALPADNISPQAPSYVAEGETTAAQLKNQLSVTYWSPALGETKLTEGTDYAVTVTNESGASVNDAAKLTAGDYTLTVSGMGVNYTGSFQVRVTAVNADSLINLGQGESLTYRLNGQTRTLTPMASGHILRDCAITVTAHYNRGGAQTTHPVQGADGSFSIDLTHAGTYTVVVTRSEGSGASETVYFGTVTYVVLPKDISEGNTAGDGEATLNEPEGDFSYTGSEVFPTNAGRLLHYGGQDVSAVEDGVTNYITGCSGNVNPGTATVTVYGQGNYSGARTTSFKVGEIRYTVTYRGNGAAGGTVPVDSTLYMTGNNATVMGNVGSLTGPDGTVFLGWSASQMGVIGSRDDLTGETYVSGSLFPIKEDDVTLYAVWATDANKNGKADCDEDKYSVSYRYALQDACTGLLPIDPVPYLSGASVAVAENIGGLALEGYLLLGWVPLSNAPDTLKLESSDAFFQFVSANDLYAPDRSFTMGGGDLTLYAVWGADANGNGTVDWMESKVQYFVSYDANGGTGLLPPSKVLEPETLSFAVAEGFDPSKLSYSGHTLLGWSTEQLPVLDETPESSFSAAGDIYTIKVGASNPVVLYAVWAVDENGNGTPDYEESHYTISYESVCGDVTVPEGSLPAAVAGKVSGISIILPDADGITAGRQASFLGWTTDREAAQKLYLRGETPDGLTEAGMSHIVSGDTVFYAVWGETDYHVERYTVTVTPSPTEGGTASATESTVLKGGTSTVKIEVKAGYALSQVLVNGKVQTDLAMDDTGRLATLKLENITENQSVVVTFARSQFRVAWPNAVTYRQERQEPVLRVYKSDNSGEAVAASDYTVSVACDDTEMEYSKAFVDAGSYIITVTGTEGSEYEGSIVRVPYIITPAILTGLTLKNGARPYKGTAYQDEVSEVKAGELTVPKDGYTVLYSNNLNVGTASVAVAGIGNYTGTLTDAFEITVAAPGSLTVSWDTPPSLTYDGQPHKPAPTVKQGDTALVERVDYTLSYPADVTAAGEKSITVTGVGNFAGASATISYTVKQKSLAEGDRTDGTAAVAALAIPDQRYTGAALEPSPILTYGAAPVVTLTGGADYTAVYADNTAVGGASVTVTGQGNYTGTRTVAFQIVPAGGALTAESTVTKTYNGQAQPMSEKELDVKLGGTPLKKDADYTVAYTPMAGTGAKLENGAPRNAGTYVATITAQGSYHGTAQTFLIITPVQLTEPKEPEEVFAYDGKPHAPALGTIMEGQLTLTEQDYTVEYIAYTERDEISAVTAEPPTQTGSYGMRLNGRGNFTGEKIFRFAIISGTVLTVGQVSDAAYSGLPYMPHPEVREGERVLTENVDYTLEYPDDVVNAGSKTVKVTGIRNYEGAVGRFAYSISKKSLEDKTAVQVAVSDQIYDGTEKTPDVSVTYQTPDGRVLFLTKDSDFTVSYADNREAGTATVTVTGQGNYADTRTVTFQIAAAGKSLTMTVTPFAFSYNGTEQEPTAITVKDGTKLLTFGTDYTLRYRAVTGTLGSGGKPLGAGAYDVIAEGKGNYAGAMGRASMVIAPAALGEAAVTGSGAVYDGTAQTPAVTVKNAAGEPLILDTDYTLTYQNNVNAGTATVTVTGMGNYTGTQTLDFLIARAKLIVTPTNTGKEYGTADGALTYTTTARAECHFEGALTRRAGEAAAEYPFSVETLRETSGNYDLELAADAVFTIAAKSIEADTEGVSQTQDITVGYTGQAVDRAVTTVYQAVWGELVLAKGADYTVTYEKDGSEVPEAVEPGRYTVTVTGQGNYAGSYAFELTIDDGVLGVAFQDTDGDTVTYNGTDWAVGLESRLAATFEGAPVSLRPEDLAFRQGGAETTELKNAGAYTIVVHAGGYAPVELPFLILPKEIGDPTVDVSGLAGEHIYSGAAQEPAITVTDGTALTAGSDYTAVYRNNTNAGEAEVVVAGIGNYTGVRTECFSIAAKALPDDAVGGLSDAVYTGYAQMQKPVVAGLVEGLDYTLSYSGSLSDVGMVTVSVTGVGNYAGSVERSYQITPRTILADWLTVSPDQLVYTGLPQEPLVLVVDGAVRLTAGADYALTYQNHTGIGTATVTVTGQGNYQGTVEKTFTITANAASLSAGLNANEAVYNGKNQRPTLTVYANGAAISEYTAVYTKDGGAQSGFDAAASLVDAGVYTITITGTGNYAGASATAVFVIRPAELVVEPLPEQDYTGGPVTPRPTVKGAGGETITNGVDYLLSYANNVALGENTASVTVTGIGNYAGSVQTLLFTITGENTLFYVSYDGNGAGAGELPADGRGYLSGDWAAVLSGEGLSRANAVFLGWSRTKSALVTTQAGQNGLTLFQPGDKLLVSSDVTLYAVWAADSDHSGKPDYAERVTITASAGEGGAIAPDGRHTVDWGTPRVEYVITVESGYTFSGLTVDGQRVSVSTPEAPTALTRTEAGYVYVFTDVKADHVILASFRQNGGGGGGGGGSEPVPPSDDGPVSPAESGVEQWLNIGDHTAYMHGRTDGFAPNENLTRAEAAMLFYALLKEKNVPVTVSFSDVPEGAWYTDAVLTLASVGILKGTGAGRFEPDRPITRPEFAALVCRMANDAEDKAIREYTDVDSSAWYYNDVHLAYHYGWMMGYPDGSFGVDRNITRAEAAKLVNHMTGRLADRQAIDGGAGARFADVSEAHWAFYEIVEAATTHGHKQAGGKETWQVS